ncbi:MAG: sigma-54-dependent transcriptional regulator [Sagittula sp.]|jgi:two-component system, NtrC family, response regulator HupR/HoxA|uniref:sigma-54-dependent transcriptional regulator n=1 Tax=unclassified Sagittula TaxID=2624628 RepID=UPI000C2CED75|nr:MULTISPECIES: sigma-54 dependent transcriptional regulator [unclassified Sagittula]AUC54518.1 sigma-54-dependent Fis family transcriptional regulator [Sagittula sp. P11]WHZ34138.1 sigma-54 dependent transcriptional regulator [Sagittula sp. MA-2]
MADASTLTLPTILLVDDEEHALNAMRMALEDDFDCLCALNADEAEALMEDNFVQVVICDQRMPGRSGVDFLSAVRDRWPETVRIIITGYAETQDMIAAINDAGIYQLITKPWHPDQLIMMAKNAADLFRLNRDHERMSLEMRFLTRSVEHKLAEKRRALREGLGFEKILRSANSPMNPVVAQARQFASFDVSVMIVGEEGTGKAEMARAIHYGSLRSDRAFHEVNVVGVDDRILEIELFGHKRGAVPNLQTNGVGLLQKADRGTLFLNGIESLSPRMQLQLQQVATEGVFRPVGGHETLRSGARLIAGSSRDLRAEVEAGNFRADLFYALAQTTLQVPPLRARLSDLPLLAQEMLFEAASRHGKIVHGLCEDAVDFLKRYHWPGNLRELENEVLRMLIFAQDAVLGPELISRHILQAAPSEAGREPGVDAVLADTGSLKERVEQIEMRILRETLTRLRWNKSRAASELGLSRVGLRAKIERYGIEEPRKAGMPDDEEE